MDYSYSNSHFSPLPKSVSKKLVNCFCRRVSYASLMIDPFIIGFSCNEVKSHLHICDNSIIPFGIRGFYLVFSNTSYVESLYRVKKLFLRRSNSTQVKHLRIERRKHENKVDWVILQHLFIN